MKCSNIHVLPHITAIIQLQTVANGHTVRKKNSTYFNILRLVIDTGLDNILNKTGNVRIKVTSRRILATIVAVQKH
jgi:hypothetical protein